MKKENKPFCLHDCTFISVLISYLTKPISSNSKIFLRFIYSFSINLHVLTQISSNSHLKSPKTQHSYIAFTITMFTRKPTSRFIFFTLILVLFLSFLITIKASDATPNANDEEDLEGLEELIALDEEEERQELQEGSHSVRSSEAEVLTKAQRIVLELNNDNTKRAIDGNEFVLILGYAPWCARSAELMPQFAEAATSLKELGSPLLMAKLDADRHTKAASTLGIKGFPTLLLFVNGTSQAYTGGLSA